MIRLPSGLALIDPVNHSSDPSSFAGIAKREKNMLCFHLKFK
jgi:hypothetical protein